MKKLYHLVELKFWHLIIPQLNPSKPIGRILRRFSQVNRLTPIFKLGMIAFAGGLIGTLGGVLLFTLVA